MREFDSRYPLQISSESPSLVNGTCFGSRHNVSSNPTLETIFLITVVKCRSRGPAEAETQVEFLAVVPDIGC